MRVHLNAQSEGVCGICDLGFRKGDLLASTDDGDVAHYEHFEDEDEAVEWD